MEYHKIQTVYKRTERGELILGEWARPEFKYLQYCDWVGTEKVDGTNIRVIWTRGESVEFRGKTDNAQLYAPLVKKLQERFPLRELDTIISPDKADSLILYGEGYGAKIQKGGGNYIPDGVDFVLFDVNVDGVWLEHGVVNAIALQLSISSVPVMFIGDLPAAISLVQSGLSSTWGNFDAEGLVLRPETELHTRLGSRIITKIKTKDFARIAPPQVPCIGP